MSQEKQRIALKVSAILLGFQWAFVSLKYEWGWVYTLMLCVAALAFAASAARDLGEMGANEWREE